jgi:hypothetical protein
MWKRSDVFSTGPFLQCGMYPLLLYCIMCCVFSICCCKFGVWSVCPNRLDVFLKHVQKFLPVWPMYFNWQLLHFSW